MRKGVIIAGALISAPLILYSVIVLLIDASRIVESLDDVYGHYRTTDGKIATINPYHMGYFHYRDAAGRCIDFWPMLDSSPPVIGGGHGCRDWQRNKTWSATRVGDASIVLTNQDGQTIGLNRISARGRWTSDGLHYDPPMAKSRA